MPTKIRFGEDGSTRIEVTWSQRNPAPVVHVAPPSVDFTTPSRPEPPQTTPFVSSSASDRKFIQLNPRENVFHVTPPSVERRMRLGIPA